MSNSDVSLLNSKRSFSIDCILSPDFGKVTRDSTSNLAKSSSTISLKENKRKPRTTFSKKQLTQLESSFAKSQYITLKDLDVLTKTLGLQESCIRTWFQNRRMKIKRKDKYNAMPTLAPASNSTSYSLSMCCAPYCGPPEHMTYFTETFYTQRQHPGVICNRVTNDCFRPEPTTRLTEISRPCPERVWEDLLQPCQPFSVAAPIGAESRVHIAAPNDRKAYPQQNNASAKPYRLSHFPMKRKSESASCEIVKKHCTNEMLNSWHKNEIHSTTSSTRQMLHNGRKNKGSCKLNSVTL